ncbi:MAG: magnesium transporter [Pseudomonadota bacterium]|nr:magnesium transporter [Pseudomonadota bacterium]
MLKNKIHAYVIELNEFRTVRDLTIESLKELMTSDGPFWIELSNLEQKDLIDAIFKDLGIHHLILEDIYNVNQRAKIEILEHQVFCVLGLIQKKHDNRIHFQTLKLNMILSEKCLITFNTNLQDSQQKIDYKLLRESLSKNTKPKIEFLAYLIIQQMMDFFYLNIDQIAERLESMEDLLIESPMKVQLKDIYLLKRKILFLRKIIVSYCDVAEIFYKGKISYIHKENQIYFMNLYEQTNRTLQSLDFYQLMISNVYDVYLSSMSNYSNQSINTLTRFAAIFVPLSFITSFYGMNLYMPETVYKITYPIVLGVMAATASSMYYLILRKKSKK